MNKEDPQVLIADLCERFTKIFEEIKEIKESRQALESENQELSSLINEEIQNHQKSIENLQKEILELQEVKDKESDYFGANPVLEKELIKMNGDIENQRMMVSLLEKKRHDLLEKTSILKNNKIELASYVDKISKDLENQKEILNKIKNSTENFEKKQQEIEANSSEIQRKYEILLREFAKNERNYKEIVEEKMRREDEHKAISNEYRDLLKRNSNCAKTAQETEKEVNKYSEELKVKIQRLEVLLKLNGKMSNRLLKLEEEALVYEKLIGENKGLQHNNQILQEKIEILTNQSLNFDFKVQIKKMINQLNSKSKNLVPNFSVLKNVVNFNEETLKKNKDDNEVEDIIKQNIYLEEYVKSLEKNVLQQNNEIFENKKKIKEQEERLREMKEVAFSNKIDRENMEKKLEMMKDRMQSYGKKTNFLGENK